MNFVFEKKEVHVFNQGMAVLTGWVHYTAVAKDGQKSDEKAIFTEPYEALIFSFDPVAADFVGWQIIEKLRRGNGLPKTKAIHWSNLFPNMSASRSRSYESSLAFPFF